MMELNFIKKEGLPKWGCGGGVNKSTPLFQYPESMELFIEDPAFSPSYDLDPPPPSPFTLTSISSTDVTHRKTEKERQIADERGGRGWGGDKSYDGEKSWSSINHSIIPVNTLSMRSAVRRPLQSCHNF
jgi:hypothetical protein